MFRYVVNFSYVLELDLWYGMFMVLLVGSLFYDVWEISRIDFRIEDERSESIYF